MRSQVVFYINGQRHTVGAAEAGLMLADYLRKVRNQTGTKIVCAEGDCGACSVLRKAPGEKTYRPFNSCVTPVALVDGLSLVTVEGLAAANGELSPEQKAMRECHGSQCGFCTPGFVVALAGLNEKRGSAELSAQQVRNVLTGNLCRCTGYQPIVDAALAMKPAPVLRTRYAAGPQEADLKRVRAQSVKLESDAFQFFAPQSSAEASDILRKGGRLVGAGTDLGVVHNKRKLRLDRLVSLHLVPRADAITVKKNSVRVGPRATLTDLRQALKKTEPEFARFLDLFASPQIKNVATLAGNVANASPIGDTPPFLLAMDAQVHVQSGRKTRKIPLQTFYRGYRKTALQKGEFISAIEWKPRGKGDFLRLYKVSQRKDLDISAVSCAFRVVWGPQGRVKSARLALGGVAATPLRLPAVEKIMVGQEWNEELRLKTTAAVQKAITPMNDLRGTAAFRRVLVENLLRRFFREAAAEQRGAK